MPRCESGAFTARSSARPNSSLASMVSLSAASHN